jgi:hypothetical protein
MPVILTYWEVLYFDGEEPRVEVMLLIEPAVISKRFKETGMATYSCQFRA